MKRLSKFLSMILIAAMIVTGFTGLSGNTKVSAADQIKVYVTIADDTGKQVVKQKTVEVSDVDEDGAYTVYDALYCAHEKYFKGGAEEGFAAYSDPDYGLSLTKLWGVENGGCYGYMVNDAYAWNLADPVAEKDQINAYCYVDTATFSDKYTHFNTRIKSISEGKTLKLKLTGIEWDYMAGVPNEVPIAGAKILVNEKDTGLVTSKKGYVKIPAVQCGSFYISAASDDSIIIAPACVVFVQPLKGETITVDKLQYTVTKNGKVSTGKKGKVTFSKSANGDKEAPKTIEYAGVAYKVKVVD